MSHPLHTYREFCPDELQPDSRDPECQACRELVELDERRARVVELEGALRDVLPHAEMRLKTLPNNNSRVHRTAFAAIERTHVVLRACAEKEAKRP